VAFVFFALTSLFSSGNYYYGLAGAMLFGLLPMSIVVASLPKLATFQQATVAPAQHATVVPAQTHRPVWSDFCPRRSDFCPRPSETVIVVIAVILLVLILYMVYFGT
jgi:hypothetical protein